MKKTHVRLSSALLVGATVMLAACGDKEVGAKLLKPVHAGMPRDSVAGIIGKGPLTGHYSDTLRIDHGFRRSAYFINSKLYEVLYYREAPGDVAEGVEKLVETPIVLLDGKVLGWGWKFYGKAMKEYGLPTPLQAKAPEAPAVVPAPAPAGADTSAKGPKA